MPAPSARPARDRAPTGYAPPHPLASPGGQALAVTALLLLFTATGLFAARTHTPTVDEFFHLPVGLYHLRTGRFDIDCKSGPLPRILASVPLLLMGVRLDTDPRWRGDGEDWAPWIFATRFMDVNRSRYLDLFFAGRLVILALGVAGGLVTFAWARTLFGPVAALGALLLYCTMPPIVAHASLATADAAVATFLLSSFAALHRFARMGGWRWAAASGVLAGMAFASKFVAIFALALFPVLLAVEWRPWTVARIRRWLAALALVGLLAVLALDASYLFSDVLVPTAVVRGLRLQARDSVGELPTFLLGGWTSGRAPEYYLVALLLKLPLPSLVLIAVGVSGLVRDRTRHRDAPWLVFPPLLLGYVLAFHYRKYYGVRYLLPALPFLVIAAGDGIRSMFAGRRRWVVALVVLLVWQLVACTAATPHQLAYFNELAGGPDRARRVLLDSNLDWGQDLGRLKAWMDANRVATIGLAYFGHVDPALYGITYTLPPASPAPGLYAISANYLAGYPYGLTFVGPEIVNVPFRAWSWLDRYQPIARIGRSIYVFRVDGG